MHFSNPRAHGVPLFVSAKILPLNLLYVETVSNPMYDISKNSPAENICSNFLRCSSIHSHDTRASKLENVIRTTDTKSRHQRVNSYKRNLSIKDTAVSIPIK